MNSSYTPSYVNFKRNPAIGKTGPLAPKFKLKPTYEEDPYWVPDFADPAIIARRKDGKRPHPSTHMIGFFRTPQDNERYFKEIDSRCKLLIEKGIKVDYSKIEEEEYEKWVRHYMNNTEFDSKLEESRKEVERNKRLIKASLKLIKELSEEPDSLAEDELAPQKELDVKNNINEKEPKRKEFLGVSVVNKVWPNSNRGRSIKQGLGLKTSSLVSPGEIVVSNEDLETLKEYYPTEGLHCISRMKTRMSETTLKRTCRKHNISVISLGNYLPFTGYTFSFVEAFKEALMKEGLTGAENKFKAFNKVSSLTFLQTEEFHRLAVHCWYSLIISEKERSILRSFSIYIETAVKLFKYRNLSAEEVKTSNQIDEATRFQFRRCGNNRIDYYLKEIKGFFRI